MSAVSAADDFDAHKYRDRVAANAARLRREQGLPERGSLTVGDFLGRNRSSLELAIELEREVREFDHAEAVQ